MAFCIHIWEIGKCFNFGVGKFFIFGEGNSAFCGQNKRYLYQRESVCYEQYGEQLQCKLCRETKKKKTVGQAVLRLLQNMQNIIFINNSKTAWATINLYIQLSQTGMKMYCCDKMSEKAFKSV